MSEPKPFASLSPSLLARKGAARPAMRPQILPLTAEDKRRMGFGPAVLAAEPAAFAAFDADDLGWNDHGEDLATPQSHDADIVALTAEPVAEPVHQAERPEVLRQIEALADVLSVPAPAPAANRRERGTALKEGRKAAFTLRLDAARHLRLRLACTVDNRSAQQLVVEALDRFLEAKPGLDDLARRALRT